MNAEPSERTGTVNDHEQSKPDNGPNQSKGPDQDQPRPDGTEPQPDRGAPQQDKREAYEDSPGAGLLGATGDLPEPNEPG